MKKMNKEDLKQILDRPRSKKLGEEDLKKMLAGADLENYATQLAEMKGPLALRIHSTKTALEIIFEAAARIGFELGASS